MHSPALLALAFAEYNDARRAGLDIDESAKYAAAAAGLPLAALADDFARFDYGRAFFEARKLGLSARAAADKAAATAAAVRAALSGARRYCLPARPVRFAA